MEEEIWKDISDYEGSYAISSFGRVKSYRTDPSGKIMARGTRDPDNYPTVMLYSGKRESGRQYNTHILVAQHFLPEPSEELKKVCALNGCGKPMVNHKDGNKWNNHKDNLEWCTYAHNNKNTVNRGKGVDNKGENSALAVLKESDIHDIMIMRSEGMTERQIATAKNVKRSTIASIMQGFSWSHITGIKKKVQKPRVDVVTERIAES